MREIQLTFFPKLLPNYRVDHGGDIGKGKRKGRRPYSPKNAHHIVFRSVRARGGWSLLTPKNKDLVKKILKKCADRHYIKVYRFVNVGNHLHLLIKTKSNQHLLGRKHFAGFLREFGGAVAFYVTGAKKASPQGGFWEKRVYSRIVSWGREVDRLKMYFVKNFLESKGFPRETLDPVFRYLSASMTDAGIKLPFLLGVGPPLGACWGRAPAPAALLNP